MNEIQKRESKKDALSWCLYGNMIYVVWLRVDNSRYALTMQINTLRRKQTADILQTKELFKFPLWKLLCPNLNFPKIGSEGPG